MNFETKSWSIKTQKKNKANIAILTEQSSSIEDFFIRQNDFALVRIKNDRFTFER